jgi:hypothetical protein
MRSFSEFDAALGADDLRRAEEARLRSLATWGYLLLRPGMEFVRQRSNFILGGGLPLAERSRRVHQRVQSGALAFRRWVRG